MSTFWSCGVQTMTATTNTGTGAMEGTATAMEVGAVGYRRAAEGAALAAVCTRRKIVQGGMLQLRS